MATKDISGRIVGGIPVDIKQYPWQVSLHSSYSHQCGGSIISNHWVLSASHCKEAGVFPSDWTAYMGISAQRETKMDSDAVNPAFQTHVVVSRISAIIQPFPMWDSDSYFRDVALFRLAQPVVYSDYIMPICVDGFVDPAHGAHANVSGFGDTKNRAEGENFQASETLNSVDVKIVGKEICQNWYSGDHTIQPDQICAGHEAGGKDSCVGDSGGPLVQNAPDITRNGYYWYQIGIVSFGFECAKPKEPGIYASVSYHSSWIKSAAAHFDANFL